MLLGGSFPDDGGAARRGHRTIGWAVYDSTHNDFLHRNDNVCGSVVHHSLTPDEIPPALTQELIAMAESRWPSPWKETIGQSFRQVRARTTVKSGQIFSRRFRPAA